jgi:hypothetical protein
MAIPRDYDKPPYSARSCPFFSPFAEWLSASYSYPFVEGGTLLAPILVPSFEGVSDKELRKRKKWAGMKVFAGLPLVVVQFRWWYREVMIWHRTDDLVKRKKFNTSAVEHFGEDCTLYDVEG